ncbi:MAG: hypothetical protein EPN86_01065 [Nanoarchaeota archaeon]|nr:MAG: hypothetical protein EPN86_01065 [Nanoarchaeota archaeon]
MFNKILAIGLDGFRIDESCWEQIKKRARKVVSLSINAPIDKELDADCLLVDVLVNVDDKLISKFPNLVYIGVFGVGYGRVDAKAAFNRNIVVTNIPGAITESVAEFAIAVILAQIRDLEKARKQAREGNYSESGFAATELKGKVFGVFGLGRIGRRVAELASGFNADVRYWSRERKEGFVYSDIDDLLTDSDFVSINFALNRDTKGFFDSKMIMAFKPDAVVVNTSPMELFDIKALDKRLSKNNLTFIFDHSDEVKPEDLKMLARHQNCIIYPPIAYISKEAKAKKQEIFVKNLDSFIEGKAENTVR